MRMTRRALRAIEEAVPALLLGVITIIISTDVAGRYLFNSPLRGSGEIAIVLVVWMAYLACASLVQRGVHIAIDVVYLRFSKTVQFALDIAAEAILIAVMSIITWHAVVLIATGSFITMPATGMSKSVVTLAIPVGFTLSMLHSILRMAAAIGEFKRSPREYVRDEEPFDAGYEEFEAPELARRLPTTGSSPS